MATFLLVGLSEGRRWLLSSWLMCCYLEAIGGYFPPGWCACEVLVATFLMVSVLLVAGYRWLLSSLLVCLRSIGGDFAHGWCCAICQLSVATFLLVGLSDDIMSIGGYFPLG